MDNGIETDQQQDAPVRVGAVEVRCCDRWQAYRRLQELDIPCYCRSHEPLQVGIESPIAALQLWSVIRQVSKPRAYLANWLETCWEMPSMPDLA